MRLASISLGSNHRMCKRICLNGVEPEFGEDNLDMDFQLFNRQTRHTVYAFH